MRADLREKLAVVWGKQEKTGVTPVTGVTRGTSEVITHATESVTVVTATPVTPQDANGYGGYDGYASKIAIASEVQEQSDLTVVKSRVTGVGTNPRAVPCPTDIVERAAIIAEGDGCSRAEADCRALAEHGQPSWQDLAERHRVEITSALERLPKRCTSEGTRLLNETRKFVASPRFEKAIALGWSRIELFGIAPDAPKTHLGTWGLIVTQVLLLRGGRIEAISEERAILWTRAGTELLWPRFRSEINACVLWWECPEFVQSNES